MEYSNLIFICLPDSLLFLFGGVGKNADRPLPVGRRVGRPSRLIPNVSTAQTLLIPHG
ncbi:MAG: hypothetical protein FWG68_02560 [Defluviitaleaceae bacterium]|nr:hypothetical protein [Defluviitaleaceae bacterium]